jgi:hypothetical protein
LKRFGPYAINPDPVKTELARRHRTPRKGIARATSPMSAFPEAEFVPKLLKITGNTFR